MLREFERKVVGSIAENKLIEAGDRILLAISGGADSTALLHMMSSLKDKEVLQADFVCGHINHQLRMADSDADENFVATQARILNLPIVTRRVDVRGFAIENKLSIETAARDLRIEALIDIAKVNGCRKIVTAHQKDDNAETVLHRLLRGTGFRGLGGIWPIRDFDGVWFVRPMLCVSRSEIIEYLKERDLKWRHDYTNDDCRYRRNFIRNKLLPTLQQQCNDSVSEELFKLSCLAQRFYSKVCVLSDKIWNDSAEFCGQTVTLGLKSFFLQHPAVKLELIRRGLVAIGSGEKGLTQEHYDRILRLAEQKKGGKTIILPDEFSVCCEYEKLIFERPKEVLRTAEQIGKSIKLQIPGQAKFGDYFIEAVVLDAKDCDVRKFKPEKTKFVEWFDLEKLKQPLVLRFRQAGDRFIPFGLNKEKKVGKFMTDERVPKSLREKVMVIADGEKMVWLWPIRISELCRVEDATQKILQLQIKS